MKKNNLVILDIDGVLNPYYASNGNPQEFSEIILEDNIQVFLNLNMQRPYWEKISELSTIVWGSAWEGMSNHLSSVLGFDELEWIPISRTDVGLGTWKIRSIQKWLNNNELKKFDKIVWLDDELEQDAFDYADSLENMLCIAPDRELGLTEKDYEQIIEFLSN